MADMFLQILLGSILAPILVALATELIKWMIEIAKEKKGGKDSTILLVRIGNHEIRINRKSRKNK